METEFLTVSSVSGYLCIAALTGYGIGKAHSFFRVIIKRSSGTY